MIKRTSEVEREKILIDKEMRNIFHIFELLYDKQWWGNKASLILKVLLGKDIYENAELLGYKFTSANPKHNSTKDMPQILRKP